MRRIPIFKVLLLALILSITSSLLIFFSVPKSLILDRFLSKRGINLISGKVEEGAFKLRFEDVRLFFKDRLFADPETLSIGFGLPGMLLLARCGGGYLEGKVDLLGDVSLKAVSLRCLKGVGRMDGDIRLEEGKIFGKVYLRKLEIKGIDVDSIDLKFKGRRFEGSIEYRGMKLKGGGDIRLKPTKLEDSELNAVFRGSVGRFTLKGKLGNLNIQLR